MIITFKTLQQQTFKVEIDENETVAVLKKQIQTEKGKDGYPADGMKLIYAGKILNDDLPLKEYKLDVEKSFVVVMVSKAKVAAPAPAPTPAAATSTPQAAAAAPSVAASGAGSTAAAEAKPAEEAKTTSASQTTAATTTTSTPVTTSSDSSAAAEGMSVTQAESALVTGQDYEDIVVNIMNLGYNREQVESALRASFNNPDRAAEYLMSGIPQFPAEPAAELSEGQGESGEGEAEGVADLSAEGQLNFLRDSPQFQSMRLAIQQDPNLLQQLLHELGQSNPQLLQLISNNQQQFISMLNEPSQGDASQPQAPGQPEGEGEQAPAQAGGQAAPPGMTYVQITPQEKEAIDRLKAMGFPEPLVIQAYFACEKNENMAANFLIQQSGDS